MHALQSAAAAITGMFKPDDPVAKLLADEREKRFLRLKEAENRIALSPDGKLFIEYLHALSAGDFSAYHDAQTHDEKRYVDGKVDRLRQIEEALVRAGEVLANRRLKEKTRA